MTSATKAANAAKTASTKAAAAVTAAQAALDKANAESATIPGKTIAEHDYNTANWPDSKPASKTTTVVTVNGDPSKYTVNWSNVVKYFYQYLNELRAANGVTGSLAPTDRGMAYANKQAAAQTGVLEHKNVQPNSGENLAGTYPSSWYGSDQEFAYSLLMGWFDESENVFPAGSSLHYGHRTNLLFSEIADSGLGYNPKVNAVAFDYYMKDESPEDYPSYEDYMAAYDAINAEINPSLAVSQSRVGLVNYKFVYVSGTKPSSKAADVKKKRRLP